MLPDSQHIVPPYNRRSQGYVLLGKQKSLCAEVCDAGFLLMSIVTTQSNDHIAVYRRLGETVSMQV